MISDLTNGASSGGLSRRTILRALPAVALGTAIVGAGVIGSPQPASAATYQGLPGDAVGVSLTTKSRFVGFNTGRTLATFRLPGDPESTRRSRMFYGEYYSVDDIRRLRPYVQYICVKKTGDVTVWNGDGSYITTLTTGAHWDDHRRLSYFQPYQLPAGARELYREGTRGAQWVKYQTSAGQTRYKIFWYDGNRNYWKSADVAGSDPRWEQFASGYGNIKYGNQIGGVTLTTTALGASWAGNIIIGGGLGALAGGAGLAIIVGLSIYYVYDACFAWGEGYRYMEMVF